LTRRVNDLSDAQILFAGTNLVTPVRDTTRMLVFSPKDWESTAQGKRSDALGMWWQ
jgi:hypothetical protein